MTSPRNIDTVVAAMAAASAGRVDEQLALYTDDAVIEVVLGGRTFAGADTLRGLFAMAHEHFPISITIDELVPCADPDQLVVEMHAEGRVAATGKTFTKRYLTRFWFSDGAISRQREFFDPAAMTAAMQPD
ncbi:MAG: nuclear transport factor 2 family protein [Actinobacteria bacterium]|nr:nuclear transport factor 2 family protein [Actinomycetota bacterium]